MATSDQLRPTWSAEGGEKRNRVQSMFATIAPQYDQLNAYMSLFNDHRWRAAATQLLELKPGDVAVDLCCGTGSFLPHLRRAVGSSGEIVALDFCLPMLARSSQKDGSASLGLADACQIPLATGSVDAVSVGWGIRNVPDIDLAHQEIARVLKPGGRFVSLDMAKPQNSLIRGASTLACMKVLPILGGLFGHKEAYTYLPKSAELFLSREELAESMRRAGFDSVLTQDFMLGNICAHVGRKG